jgi:hypothetical protein
MKSAWDGGLQKMKSSLPASHYKVFTGGVLNMYELAGYYWEQIKNVISPSIGFIVQPRLAETSFAFRAHKDVLSRMLAALQPRGPMTRC